MHARIKEIQPMADFILSVVFFNGVQKQYDMKPWIEKNKAFLPLRTMTGLFETVRPDVGGYGAVWNDEIDLDAEELWQNGRPV